MGDQDWLEKGHGGGEGLSPMIKGSTADAVDRVSIRGVLRGTDAPKPRVPRRRNKVLVGWLLYCAIAAGGTAAAFTVRDALFPSLGAPTENRVWPDPTAATSTLATEHGSSTIARTDATVTATTLVEATVATLAQSVDAETPPTVARRSQGPGNSIDNSGSGSGGAPAPGTTVDNSTSGPGPGTTVDNHPTDTSTPSSASTPPSNGDATPTSASTPGTPDEGTSPNKGSGKGGGGGGGGDHDAPPTP